MVIVDIGDFLERIFEALRRVVYQAVARASLQASKEAEKILTKRIRRLRKRTGALNEAVSSGRAIYAFRAKKAGKELKRTRQFFAGVKRDPVAWYINAAYSQARYIRAKQIWTRRDLRKLRRTFEYYFTRWYNVLLRQAIRSGNLAQGTYNIRIRF